MSRPARHEGRLHRSFAAVESSYVLDLGRRERGSSPTARRVGRPEKLTHRRDMAHRREQAGAPASVLSNDA